MTQRINSTRTYLVYTALLNQSDTNAPTTTILENTLGFTPIFIYQGIGHYTIEKVSGFPFGKTYCVITNNDYFCVYYRHGSPDYLDLYTFNDFTPNRELGDNWLIDTPIEIRVYA